MSQGAGATGGTTANDPSQPDGGGSAGEGDPAPGPKFDTPGGADDGVNGPGCDKVDFLFVVDNSGSMEDEQQNLVASFAGFISTIRDTLQAMDYQIMVVDTDQPGGATGDTHCGPDPDSCDEYCAADPTIVCNDLPCPGVGCDSKLGTGITSSAAGSSCGVTGGNRYLVDGQPDLETTFACLAQVGTQGNGNEQAMGAMSRAIGPLSAPNGCNEGFVRDDAILVITIITDEDDGGLLIFGSEGDPPAWKEAVLDAKGGHEDAIVILGLIGDTDLPGAVCAPYDDNGNGAKPAPRLRQFVELFGARGKWASVCEADYTPFFVDATATIDTTCDDFDPEG